MNASPSFGRPTPPSRHRSPLASALLGLLLTGAGWLSTASAQLPAFPGAEGAGAFAKGGRGGDVYHVTNLNASGAGSLANGFVGVPSTGRTIVFDVSGYIPISGTLTCNAANVTIAGQTAPGDGIGVRNGTFRLVRSECIIRHIRFRDGNSADAVNVDGTATNTIFDHCDMLLSNDENFSSFNTPPENLTFQWSMNSWGMETHSAGGLWDQHHATAHHTLWSHNHTRNPKARPDGCLDWINNVTFDWDIGFIMGDSETPANWRANVRGCYFVCPPGNIRSVAIEGANLDRNGVPNFHLFVDDSVMDSNGDGVLNVSKTGFALASGNFERSTTPFPNNGLPVAIDDPLTAYKKVVSAAGPLRLDSSPVRPLRDELSAILINNLVTQRRNHVSEPAGTGASNGGFGTLVSSPAPTDTDRDGLPDFWEIATGSSPSAASNNNSVPAGAYLPSSPAGYTLLEDYLHFLALPHTVVEKNAAVDIDLRKFTSGFTKSPVFALSNSLNGTATLQSNGSTVRFVPAANFAGRARFNFKVTDGDGSTWTQTFAVLVSGTPSSGPTNPGATTYPAETAVLAGGAIAESTNTGFRGTGYANLPTTGGTVTFNNVNGNGGGAKTLEIRYALGATAARSGNLTVNGATRSITFAPTGAFTTWTTLNVPITLLNSATNTIQLASTGQDLANIDEITVP